MPSPQDLLSRLMEQLPQRAENPFWDYSLQVYRHPSVAQSCLKLQHEHGVDVNVLLYCLWLGHIKAVCLTADDLEACLQGINILQENVITPLRHVRKTIPKEGVDTKMLALRDHIQLAELWAEHLEQDQLYGLTPTLSPVPRPDDAPWGRCQTNLDLYAAHLDTVFPPDLLAPFINFIADEKFIDGARGQIST